MNRSFSYIAQSGLSVLTICVFALAEPAMADSVIRIIGDRTPAAPNNSGGGAAVPHPSSATENSIIRIIGDKQSAVQKPAVGQAAQPEKNQSETCINDDNMGEILLNQRLDSLKTEVERKSAGNTEQSRLAEGKDEQENAAALQADIELEQKQLAAERTKKTVRPGKNPSGRETS
jgi:hypothetical protein